MKDKETQEVVPQEGQFLRPYFARPGYGRFFKKHGVFDGKMFHSHDKVTYTFVTHSEVISLHFDLLKKTIFYKGHNIANIHLKPEQLVHLELFEKELSKSPGLHNFAKSYSQILDSYLKQS